MLFKAQEEASEESWVSGYPDPNELTAQRWKRDSSPCPVSLCKAQLMTSIKIIKADLPNYCILDISKGQK